MCGCWFCWTSGIIALIVLIIYGYICIEPFEIVVGNSRNESPPGISVSEVTLSHSFKFLMNPQDLCSRGTKVKLSLLILVSSAVPDIKEREAIRNTWGSVASENSNTDHVRLGFLLGSTKNTSLQQRIEEEHAKSGDIIQQDFVDSYQNLTLKSIMLLKWVSEYCPKAQYVLKTDDDMYVNVPNLIDTLKRLPAKSNVMYGTLFQKAKPDRRPSAKWYIPKDQFGTDAFPDYLSGTAYAMSGDVVPKLLKASGTISFLGMEDVFITGLCANRSQVRRYNVEGFAHWKRPSTGCAFKHVISGHHVTVDDMKKIWKELHENSLICQ